MLMWYKNILEVIGNTPLVRINKINTNPGVIILAKLEFLNPGGSIKDRVGVHMVNVAREHGRLRKGSTIVEPTSGNTGVGLAMASAIGGFKCVFVMPDKMSDEKRNILKAYGAEVVITRTSVAPENPQSYYNISDKIAAKRSNGYKPDQYQNPANPETHYKYTGPEIWEQTEGKISHAVIAMGTGGTISGVGKFLKEKNPNIRIIGVDPIGSVYYHFFKTGRIPKLFKNYKLEGAGEDFLPGAIDFSVIDEVIRVSDKQSFDTARNLAKKEGILAGGTSGMALFAAMKVSRRLRKGCLVVIFPDSGRNYLTKFYNDEWMLKNGFIK